MSLSIGIVGLPNVGKSTVFNALARAQLAEVANYPFCTIHPNKASVPVPDPRLEKLAELVKVHTVIHATVEFVDIAGLVKGASKGEGLGNQFLGQIRETDLILHVVRCFEDENVVHVSAQLDPLEDIEVVELELALADLQQLERKIEKLGSQVKGDKKLQTAFELAHELKEHLARGKPVSNFPAQIDEHFNEMLHEMRFLTGKPVIYVANVDECGIVEQNPHAEAVRKYALEKGVQSLVLCTKLETEIMEYAPADQAEMMEIAGITESGLSQVVRSCFDRLGLISFFTKNETEARAWEISRGTTAPKAAGTIHTDFERGFIRAEVVPFEAFAQYGNDAAIRAHGKMRLEGKEYVVQDGDVILFRFNV
jgi:GTP-binding protein YchF